MEVETLPENIKEKITSMQMRHSTASLAIAVALLVGCASLAWAQKAGPAGIVIPSSSIAGPNDAGVKAHTNIEIMNVPALVGATPNIPGAPGAPFYGYGYETPAAIACIYELVLPQVPGCNPNLAYMNPTGGSRAIAIVDAFDDPNAGVDFAAFSAQFGIFGGGLTVTYAQPGLFPGVCSAANPGPVPPVDITGGWEVEESLDIEWAHAMAPAPTSIWWKLSPIATTTCFAP